MGSGFLKKKKQARMMHSQFSQMQEQLSEQLEKIEVVGSAGNGLVEITLSGANEMRQIRIKPECVDPEDIEGLELLIKAAHADACKKLEAETKPSSFLPGMGSNMPPNLASMFS
jgi:DNA-binding YbaB/EbfC family protein